VHHKRILVIKEKFYEGKPTWIGRIYARTNHDEVLEDPLIQESDTSESQSAKTGKPLIDLDSLYIDIDVSIPFRKLGR